MAKVDWAHISPMTCPSTIITPYMLGDVPFTPFSERQALQCGALLENFEALSVGQIDIGFELLWAALNPSVSKRLSETKSAMPT